jgi:very-short-patch-repair endonuclease
VERLLWSQLRRNQLDGIHFRRQRPIGPYFADFCCIKSRLIIELDGGIMSAIQGWNSKEVKG